MSRPPRVFSPYTGPTITVQPSSFGLDHHHAMQKRPHLPEPLVAMAEAEYERQYRNGQTADRLRERGGLSIEEVVVLLAEALSRYAPTEELTPESRRPTT